MSKVVYETVADTDCKYGSSFWFNKGILLDEKFNPMDGATYRLILEKDCHMGNSAGGVENTLIFFKDKEEIKREVVVPRHGRTNMHLLGICEIAIKAFWGVEDKYHPHYSTTRREKTSLGCYVCWVDKGCGGYFLEMRHEYSWYIGSLMCDFYDHEVCRKECLVLTEDDFSEENIRNHIRSCGMDNPPIPAPRNTRGEEIVSGDPGE